MHNLKKFWISNDIQNFNCINAIDNFAIFGESFRCGGIREILCKPGICQLFCSFCNVKYRELWK